MGDAEFWLHLTDNINDGNCAAEDELHQESYTIEMFLVNYCFPPESHFSCEIKISIFWAPTSVIFDWPDVSITSCYPISMQRLGFTVRVKSVKMFCTLTDEFGASTYIWREKENSHCRIREKYTQYTCWSLLSNSHGILEAQLPKQTCWSGCTTVIDQRFP